jgi:hypothetical protein
MRTSYSLLLLILLESWAWGQTPGYGANSLLAGCHIERWSGMSITPGYADGWRRAEDLRISCDNAAIGKPSYISGHPGVQEITQPVVIESLNNEDLMWGESAHGLPLTCKPDGTKTGWICKLDAAADEPAIQVKDGFSGAGMCAPGQRPDMSQYCIQPRDTCADKSRILQHDEQSPPKYWCHAPQTKGCAE